MALTNDDLQAIASLLQPINNRLDRMDGRLDGMDSRFDGMDSRLDRMENRLEKLESEVLSLKVGQIELVKEVREVKDKVSDTYNLALDAWGQSTENRIWIPF